jgi:hypothetical protein
MTMRLVWFVLAGLAGAWGCTTQNPWVRVVVLDDGRLRVDGPAAGPFDTQEELAESACKLMTSQPGASSLHGKMGKEYCALWYFSREDGKYYLSYLSDIGGDRQSGVKYCTVPRALNELAQRSALILGPAHPHPHNRQLSRIDMGADLMPGETPVGISRFYDRHTGRIWDRELLAFYMELNGVCRAYSYNYTTRIVSALREGKWVQIGKAEGEYAEFKAFEGQDWLP